MASAPPEPRKFARGLNKLGTAAELRQSVSEAVRTSVLVRVIRLHCSCRVQSSLLEAAVMHGLCLDSPRGTLEK
ncbi:unnamed protein product [Menidia menidia]|uniref:(Atlantic silverside) hypothetical protein n=1 Tax=Menidia menidia TaxID=238744 RepID=A0A8S4B5R0_9TELE|nr:unnamed protein product [Menidia menidia]